MKEQIKKLSRKRHGWIIVLIIFLFIGFTIFSTTYVIHAGERGVLLTFGKAKTESIGEGLNFKIPYIQQIVKMDVKTQKYEADLTAASSDLQDVSTKIAINYKIIPEQAPVIYTTLGLSYRENVIYPLEQETNKAITSQYTAEQLITKREEVRGKMKIALAEKLRERNIIVEEISIIDFKFSPSFTQAIETKVTAEQNALTAKNKLEQIKFEAEQRVVSAKAEAEALSLQKAQVTPDLIKLRQIEVQKLAIEKWNGILPQVTGNAIPFISLGGNSTF
jgi:regulator of protease activity HflC (stomatin/prohibitin superfamily)